MIEEADLPALHARLLWLSFGLALVLGIVMSRTKFCTMGAVSDIVNMGDWRRMKLWLGAIAIAIIGTQLMQATGYIDTANSIFTGPRIPVASLAAGGLMFGFGMVLASGCASKTLLRIGGGSLKSLIVFIVIGLSAYLTLKGILAVARAGSIDRVNIELAGPQTLAHLVGRAAGSAEEMMPALHAGLGLAIGFALLVFAFGRRPDRHLESLFGATAVGLAVIAGWAISGHLGYLSEHPKTLEPALLATNSGRMESLSFVGPMAFVIELLMFWSDANRLATIGIASACGLTLGAFVHAVATKSFRWEGFADTTDTANHLIGATLMGAGGVTALGCTVGQGLSGLSTLAVGSFIAFASILIGAWIGLRFQLWRL